MTNAIRGLQNCNLNCIFRLLKSQAKGRVGVVPKGPRRSFIIKTTEMTTADKIDDLRAEATPAIKKITELVGESKSETAEDLLQEVMGHFPELDRQEVEHVMITAFRLAVKLIELQKELLETQHKKLQKANKLAEYVKKYVIKEWFAEMDTKKPEN